MSIIITSFTILTMLFLLTREIFDPLKIFTLALSVFLIFGYISIDEAVEGFSNKGVLAVAALFIIAGAIEKSQLFHKLTSFENLNPSNFSPFKIFLTITGLSAFLNNTPIVSLFIPIIKRISDKTEISASKLLLPIAYLSALGGMLTLVGTSTNLVVSGLMESYGLVGLSFFELTPIALPGVIIGFTYIIGTYKFRLPDRSSVVDASIKQQNEHIVRFVVKPGASIIGATIKEAHLRSLKGVYLVAIERGGNRIFPVTPEELIKPSDLLIFTGQTDQIDELKSIDDLILETDYEFNTDYFNHNNTLLVEGVITQPLGPSHASIKDLKFRANYHAVVIGIIRNGERIQEKIGSIQPRLGDILLMIVDKSNVNKLYQVSNFKIISSEERKQNQTNNRGYIPVFAFLGTILGSLVFDVNILHSAIVAIGFLLITSTINVKEALEMIEYKTILIIAISFAIGKALTNSGTAAYIATLLTPVLSCMHPLLLLVSCFLITTFFTTIITNNAAAILAIPIVYEISLVAGCDPRPLMLITAIAASSSFLSPYGYQTNTMVYGAGGYRFKDFVSFGYPLTIIIMVASSIAAYMMFY